MGEMCSESRGSDRGAQPFFRKRKRGYWRAYRRGVVDYEILKFISNENMKRMTARMIEDFWGPKMVEEILNPHPFLGLKGIIDADGK